MKKTAAGKQILVTASRPSTREPTAGGQTEAAFGEVLGLIRSARQRAAKAANAELIDLYCRIGQYLHHRIEADGWAKGTVVQLAAYIATREPGRRGFSAQNLWRMRQFFQTYPDAFAARSPSAAKLSTLLREIPWSSQLHILSRAKRPEEREFYLRMASQQRWQVGRVLQEDLQTGRAAYGKQILATVSQQSRRSHFQALLPVQARHVRSPSR